MSTKQALDGLLASLPEERLRVVLDFALFLQNQEKRREWQRFGTGQLARAYGPNEPEHTEADLKSNRP